MNKLSRTSNHRYLVDIGFPSHPNSTSIMLIKIMLPLPSSKKFY